MPLRSSQHALIMLPELTHIDDITFEVWSPRGILSVSEIYVSETNVFETNLKRVEFFKKDLRTSLFVMELLLFVSYIGFYSVRSLGTEIFPISAILIFMMLETSVGFIEIFPWVTETSKYTLHAWPLMVWGHLVTGKNIQNLGAGDYQFRMPQRFLKYGLLCFISVPALIVWDINSDLILHVLISVPLLVLFIVYESIRSIRIFSKTQNIVALYFGGISIILMLFLLHDFGFKLGLHSNWISLSTVGGAAFVFFLASQFAYQYLRMSKELEQNEALIVKKLHEQELRLQQENAQRNDLEHKRKSLIESERISMDLHDGVMGSLQLIRVLAESATNKKMQAIYSASSDALNEIRLILEFRNTEVKSLNFFVNTVRNKFIVPLIDIEKPIAVNTNIDSFNAEIDAYLSPDVGMLKVVQEAINNAVHRAKCECLDIRFNIIEGHILEVTIENTGGQTLDMSKIEKTPGFGLKNMKRRILDSNGEFSIVSIDGGARLRFTCPLSPVQA